MPKQIRRKKDKIYLAIFIVVALVVGGFLWWWIKEANQEMSKETEIATSQASKPKEKQKAEEIDTSNWKTYVNEEYGYSLKVPEGWEETKVDDKREMFMKTYKEFSPQVGIRGEIVIDVFSNQEKLSLSEWIDRNDPTETSFIKSTKEIELGNFKGLERVFILELDGVEYRVIYVAINDFVYKIQPNTFTRFPNEETEREYGYLVAQSNRFLETIIQTLNFSS